MPRYLYDLLRHNAKQADPETRKIINELVIPAYSFCRNNYKLCDHYPFGGSCRKLPRSHV
jgi:hypothetical protein